VNGANDAQLRMMGSTKENECKAMGCRWAGNCREPEACENLNQNIKYRGADTGVRVIRASVKGIVSVPVFRIDPPPILIT
jgi:hypothetical protein